MLFALVGRLRHTGRGYQRTGITNHRGTFFYVLFTTIWVLQTEPAFSHDIPALPPTKLDFDANQGPKNCNDLDAFVRLLEAWVPPEVFQNDAERRLVVRVQRTRSGGKQADLTLVDSTGATLAEDHKTYSAQIECHSVLWAAARSAAKLLGAFEPPAPQLPVACPVCPPPIPPEPMRPQRIPGHAMARHRPKFAVPHRPTSIVGVGAFYATALLPEPTLGPRISLGFAPWIHSPNTRLEFDAAWTTQSMGFSLSNESVRLYAVPLIGSVCYAPQVVRLCSGLSTSIFYSTQNHTRGNNDPLRIALLASLRVGTEWAIHGPFSIRADVFALVRLDERVSGVPMNVLAALDPFIAGATLMGTWALN